MAGKTALGNEPRQANNRIVLVPQYMKDFVCIGAACEENCCETSWAISVDKKAYLKYRKVKDKELRTLLDKHVTRNRSRPSEAAYAKMKLGKDGRCVFLNEKSLCALQLKLGEQYLCNTCAIYPRQSNTVDGILETCASLSCPEVARHVLLNEKVMEFEYIEEDQNNRFNLKKKVDPAAAAGRNRLEQHFWELRRFVIELLQNRDFSLEERLLVLGIFCKKLDELVEAKRMGEVLALAESFRRLIRGGEIRESVAGVPGYPTVQMELLKEIGDMRLKYPFVKNKQTGNSYLKYLGQFLNAVEYTDKAELEAIGAKYTELSEQYYRPFMEKREYIMENYLVNYVFMNLFPLGRGKTVFDAYTMLAVQYGLLKMLLVGVAGFQKSLDEQTVVSVVQSFITTTENNLFFINDVFKKIKEKGFDTLALMAILVKN